MTATQRRHRVGELRPSQLLYSYGIGAVVDLPNISAMVMGLDDWDEQDCREIGEERLLAAVQQQLGYQVRRLLSPPIPQPSGFSATRAAPVVSGVPVAPFPRWMVCPRCRLLAPLKSGLFTLKADPFRPDRTRYVHGNCPRGTTPPAVLPARFLVACARGHLDDFPWVTFAHRGETECRSRLRLREFGVSGEAADLQVECETCGQRRRMSDAFGDEAAMALPACRGRWPHLRSFADEDCDAPSRAILLGASNSWFPVVLTALSIPAGGDKLQQLVDEHWTTLEKVSSPREVELLRQIGQLRTFRSFTDDEIWVAIQQKRAPDEQSESPRRLKTPEWRVFSNADASVNDAHFRLRPAGVPTAFSRVIERVVVVERLREVKALIGFARIESPGEFDEPEAIPPERRGPLARRPPEWVPASEVRGEGIFLQFREDAVENWMREAAVRERDTVFRRGHRRWGRARMVSDPDAGYPELRYILLHSFSHALMRQLALESGYAMASIRERIYALPPSDEDGPMAGILLYTAATDSEGTLGGLVRLGELNELERHIAEALEQMRVCASDPLCAEHRPDAEGASLHGAACHACLFAPETSCERGNRYLDRAVLVETFASSGAAFFDHSDARSN